MDDLKVVGPSAPGAGGKVVVMQPQSFDEAKDVADHLKARRTVIVNLEGADAQAAQRIVDFVSGYFCPKWYGRAGRQRHFLFAPSNVGVMALQRIGIENEELLPWLG